MGCFIIIWLNSSTLPKFICPLLSLSPSSPHYNLCKVHLIVLRTLHFSGGEFECHCKPMVDCTFGMSLGLWYISNKWAGVVHISPKSQVLPARLALLNLISLHDMLCGSLGMVKFEIALVVLYFFKNVLFLLTLKCFVHYLGLPLIVILACGMLWLAYFREVVMCFSHIYISYYRFSLVFNWGQATI